VTLIAFMRLGLATLLALATAACDRHAVPKETLPMSPSPVALAVRSEPSAIPVGSPIRVELTLTNVGSAPVWINRRMSVGYPDDILREVYVTVHDARGVLVKVSDIERVDAHRSPPIRSDFVELAPKQSFRADVDLTLWFPTRLLGHYTVTVTYANDDAGTAFGLQAFTGAVTTAPFDVTLASP
jgi:hypothetical protein